ncbi:hypothetical protein GQ457_02G020750 [Hibiscus cannabinus]
MNKIWWRNSNSSKGIHWCSWEKLCLPEQQGGMGFNDMSKFNIALLAKQDFMGASLGSSPSYSWRSIYSARGLLESGLGWKVGTGLDINCIGCIPIARTKLRDELIRRCENTGIYSPKSGYKLLLEMDLQQHPIKFEPCAPYMISFYKSLCVLNLPAKGAGTGGTTDAA